MDIIILISGVITAIATIVGVIAGILQIVDYYQKKNDKHIDPSSFKRTDKEITFAHDNVKLKSTANNLPPRGRFVGRLQEIESLIGAIKTNRRIIIEGVGGIGKTSLAQEVGHIILENIDSYSFEALIWITAKGVELTIDKAIDLIARTVDYPYILQLQTSEKKHEIVKLLRLKKCLIFFDNFEVVSDQELYDFLEKVPEPSKIIVTTRVQYTWNSPYILALGKLDISEGLELIRKEAENLGLNTFKFIDNSILIDLLNKTGGSPLALRWSIGQIKQRGQSLEEIIDMLESAKGDIFENMFLGAWSSIDEGCKTILMCMLFFSDTVSKEALFVTTGLTRDDFNNAVGKLVELWLIETNREIFEKRQRFSIHPLTRAFVIKETRFIQYEIFRWRAVEYYLKFCNDRRYFQFGIAGYNEIEAEIENILRVISWLENQCGQEVLMQKACEKIIQFSDAINVFFWSRGYWENRAELCYKAMKVSELLKKWKDAGKQAYFIGIVRIWQGKVEEASKWAEISSKYMKYSNTELDLALAQRLTGLVYMISGDYSQATTHLKNVLNILSKPENIEKKEIGIFADWVSPGDKGKMVGLVALLQELGIVANKAGDYNSASYWLKQSVDLAESIQDGEGLSVSFSHLGTSYLGLNQLDDAKSSFEKGLELANKFQRKSTLGRCNQGLAYISHLRGSNDDFYKYAKYAMDYFDRLGMEQEKRQMMNTLSQTNNVSSQN